MRCGRCGALLDAGGSSQELCPACLLYAAAVAWQGERKAAGDAGLPYRILTVLGEGAHGVTFLAQERSARGCLVALRLLDAAARSAIDRFEVARGALARLQHPSVGRVRDVGLGGSDRVYVVTDFVPGTPLALALKRMRGGDEKRNLARQLCEAVRTAHACGLLHLALRPSKIRVASADGAARLKVLDLGLATVIDGAQGSVADDFAGVSALLETMDMGLQRHRFGSLQEIIDTLDR